MTYAVAHVMGAAGETGGTGALTGWAFVSGWFASFLLFALALRYLSFNAALAIALIFQTVPAMAFGAGSGQVEARMAAFVLIAVAGLADIRRHGGLAPIILIGLGAGFYAASKYLGLLFVIAAAIAVVSTGRPFVKRMWVYGLVVALAGTQWYGWNFYHTGDPAFPLMYNLFHSLGLANETYWNPEFNAGFNEYLAGLAESTSQLHWIITFPIAATLFPIPGFEAGRIGLGPFFVLILPLVFVALWRGRGRLLKSQLFPVAVLLVAHYILWIELGVIPKIRHILPLIPVLMICLAAAALSPFAGRAGRPLAAAVVLSLGINFGAHGLFTKQYISHVVSGESDAEFLRRNISTYPMVEAINERPNIKGVLIWDRQALFYIKTKAFSAAPYKQIFIDTRSGHIEPRKLVRQMTEQNLTHIAFDRYTKKPPSGTLAGAIWELRLMNCLTLEQSVDTQRFASRTLKSLNTVDRKIDIWRVDAKCGA
jgi:hypothetical protein